MKINYFATSLPSLLLFDDDPQRRRDLSMAALLAQLVHGCGQALVSVVKQFDKQ